MSSLLLTSFDADMPTANMEYTSLGNSGLKISKVILGAMSLGDPKIMLEFAIPEEKALPLLKRALELGINTWDTADIYSMGDSERIIGKALTVYKVPRDRVVILSKCGGGVMDNFAELPKMQAMALVATNDGVMVNRVGLSRKHIFDAVDASVARLGTFIDVLQIHRLDRNTPKEEIMRALNDVVESGKVRYIGASSMFAWEFQELNNIAERNGWHKFISMQNHYSLLRREEEREMHPYCRHAGIGLIPWSPLARGLLTRPFSEKDGQTQFRVGDEWGEVMIGKVTAVDRRIIERVEVMAKDKGCSMAQISIAWCLKKGVNPILGLGSIARVEEAAEAVKLTSSGLLTNEDMGILDELYAPKSPVTQLW